MTPAVNEAVSPSGFPAENASSPTRTLRSLPSTAGTITDGP